jgi:hypothetical protein
VNNRSHSLILQILDKKWEYNGTVCQLFIDFKKACGLIRREVLYSIVIEFGMPRKLGVLMQMCYIPYRQQSDKFPIQNGHCFSTLLWNMPSGGSKRANKD